jgi:hypothetical protein
MSRRIGGLVGKWAAVHLLVRPIALAVGNRCKIWCLSGVPCQVIVVVAVVAWVSGQVE